MEQSRDHDRQPSWDPAQNRGGNNDRRRWKPKHNGQQPSPYRPHLSGQTVTIKWIDNSIQWNWFRVVGFEHGMIGLQPLNETGHEFHDQRETFWTPTQAIDRLVTRHVHDGDLEEWLKA